MNKFKNLFFIILIGVLFPNASSSQTIRWKAGIPADGTENGGTITLTMTAASYSSCGDPCQVQVSVKSGSQADSYDYTFSPSTQTVVISADGDYTINFTLKDDNIDENDNETLIFRMNPDGLSVVGGTSADHTYTIDDNDATPTMNVTSVSMTEAENTSWATLGATLSHPSTLTTRPSFSVSVGGTATGGGTDYNALNPTSFTFNSSSSSTTSLNTSFQIYIQDDALDEDSETITFTISPSNATNGDNLVTTLTINDNDNPPDIDFSAATGSASEGNSGTSAKTAQVTLSAASGKAVSANYTVGGTSTGGGTDSCTRAECGQ